MTTTFFSIIIFALGLDIKFWKLLTHIQETPAQISPTSVESLGRIYPYRTLHVPLLCLSLFFYVSHNAAYYACLYFIEFLFESVHAFVLVYKASWIQWWMQGRLIHRIKFVRTPWDFRIGQTLTTTAHTGNRTFLLLRRIPKTKLVSKRWKGIHVVTSLKFVHE